MGNESDPGKRTPRQRNLSLLNENAVIIEIDFQRILSNDPKGIRAQNLNGALYIDRYQGSISESVASALGTIWPSDVVKRSVMVMGKRVTNIASVKAVSVYLTFDYTMPEKPSLSVSILGEAKDQARVAEEMSRIKKSYGQ